MDKFTYAELSEIRLALQVRIEVLEGRVSGFPVLAQAAIDDLAFASSALVKVNALCLEAHA